MRRVIGHEATEIGRLGKRHRNVLRELHVGGDVPRRPGAQDFAERIVERGRNRVLAPQARPVGRAVALVGFLAPRHGASMRGGSPPRNLLRRPLRRSPVQAAATDRRDRRSRLWLRHVPTARMIRIG
jgi:hypothetical protein